MIKKEELKRLCEYLEIDTKLLSYFYDYYQEQMQYLTTYCIQQKLEMHTSHMYYFDKETKEYDAKRIKAEISHVYINNKQKFDRILNKKYKNEDDKIRAVLDLAITSSQYNWGLGYELRARFVEENLIDALKDCFGNDASSVFNLLVVNDNEFSLTETEKRYAISTKYVSKCDPRIKPSEVYRGFSFYLSSIINYILSKGSSYGTENDSDFEKFFKQPSQRMPYKKFQSVLNKHFKNYVGLDNVKREITKIVAKRDKEKPDKPYNILLTGNPGTGKSTVAKLIHTVLFECGYITKPQPTIISASGLQAKYQGHTVDNVKNLFESNKNGLIFLDEIYALVSKTDFNKEAVTELLLQLESEENAGTIVIAAGYHDKISEFFNTNPGIKSRFSTIINLKDYNLPEILEITDKYINSKNFEIEEEAIIKLENYFAGEMTKPNFGNARTIKKIVDGVMDNTNMRLWAESSNDEKQIITAQDVTDYISEEIKNEPAPPRKMGF